MILFGTMTKVGRKSTSSPAAALLSSPSDITFAEQLRIWDAAIKRGYIRNMPYMMPAKQLRVITEVGCAIAPLNNRKATLDNTSSVLEGRRG